MFIMRFVGRAVSIGNGNLLYFFVSEVLSVIFYFARVVDVVVSEG